MADAITTTSRAESRPQGSALMAIDLPSRPLAKVEEVREVVERISSQCNLLMPLSFHDYIPPMHRVSTRMISIGDSDTYADSKFCSGGERAIGKTGLMKIIRAGGGSVLFSRRSDDRSDPHYCEWSVMVRVKEMDGQLTDIPGSREIDLRDGSTIAARMSPKELGNARAHILANAETKALNRAIRAMFAIRQKYSSADLLKPFVTFALVPDFPMDDPDVKRMVVASMLHAESALYGQLPSGQQQQARADVETGAVIDVSALVEDDETREPWDDEPAAQAPAQAAAERVTCALPIDLTEVPTHDETRFNYVERLNALWGELVLALGPAKAAAVATKHGAGEGVQVVTWELPKIAALGKALKAELGGA